MQRAVPPTPLGHLVFVLHTHLPWVLGHGRWPHGEAWLYEATAECYLPILRLLDRLEKERRKGSITIGITPVLSEMLATPRFRDGFLAYLEQRTNRAEADQREFDAAGDDGRRRAAAAWSDFYGGAKADFVETYNQDLLSAFTRLQNRDRIEIIVSAATHGYLPLLGRDESINAQLATGIASYRRSFGRRPRGIWLPECAYRPSYIFFFFTDPAPTEIYTLSLHDALPISPPASGCRSSTTSSARPCRSPAPAPAGRSEEHTSELQSPVQLVCRLLLEK